MSGAIKMEGGFQSSNPMPSPPRPSVSRPFSDGSMTVESSILNSLMNHSQPFSFANGPLALSQQQPSQSNNPFDYNMVSPQSNPIDLPSSASPNSFQPHTMFGHFLGAENREPPVVATANDNTTSHGDNRSRSQSSSRSSQIGKAPPPRSRSGRKLSMTDVKPNIQSGRGRVMAPPRSMSFQTETKPHVSMAGQRANSITTMDYGFEGPFGIPIPRSDFGRPLWGPSGSAPSVLPDAMASYGTSVEGTMDSPMTPAQNVQSLIGDESRKQRRRECHNQVEKRRREHINAMIEELNKLLPSRVIGPDVAVDDEEDDSVEGTTAQSPAKKKKTKRTTSTSKQQKDAAQCKGRILSDSVEYIRDLQTVNKEQSARIRYLEELLTSYGGSSISQSYEIRNNSMSYQQHDQLEAMHASPEPERLVPLNQSGWNGFNSSTASNMLVFEPSPTDASSGPDLQRSTPISSGSPATDNKDPVVWGLMDFTEEQRPAMNTNESDEPPISHVRKDSQAELQSSLSQMELDVTHGIRRGWPDF